MENDGFVYMEDLSPGQTFEAGPISVSAEEIIAFAGKYDPQVFHLDAEKAAATPFGELVASGWHTAAMTMRMIVDSMPKMKGGMIGRTVEHMTWLRPVRPGDQLTYRGEVMDMRPSSGNPSRGVLRTKNTTFNQHGEAVMEMVCVIFIPRRGA